MPLSIVDCLLDVEDKRATGLESTVGDPGGPDTALLLYSLRGSTENDALEVFERYHPVELP